MMELPQDFHLILVIHLLVIDICEVRRVCLVLVGQAVVDEGVPIFVCLDHWGRFVLYSMLV